MSKPNKARIGGLKGLVVDMRTKPGAKLTSCLVDGNRILLAGLFSGVSPSSLDHAVIPGMTMRLFLLSYGEGVLGVELDDIDKSPGDLGQLTAVASTFQFAH